MSKLIIGFFLGLVVATAGFTGVLRMLDKGVQEINNYVSSTGK